MTHPLPRAPRPHARSWTSPPRQAALPVTLAVLLLCLNVAAEAVDRPYDFYSQGPYRSDVPRPSAILGYEAGATHSTFREQERVILAIAKAAADRVQVHEYGRSVEGRPLRLVIVTSPANRKRLEEIRGRIARLADPRTISSQSEADRIIRETPAITWISHTIHGDETASFETVMWTLYTLAASRAPEITGALEQSVVILNPVYNPDGHERYVAFYNSLAVGSPETFAFEQSLPWGAGGRGSHYRFDLNRDKLPQSQPETRQETAAYLRWNPQVYVDQHSTVDPYFFPPNDQAVNRHVDRPRFARWLDLFGRANASAFDRHGWQYVTRGVGFDFFYPGFLDTWAGLNGAIGMTYETDGGGVLALRRGDETISTLRDGIAHHLEAALATIVAAARNREALLRDFHAFRRSAIDGPPSDARRRVILVPGRSPDRAAALAGLLERMGVEVRRAAAPFRQEKARSYMRPGSAAQAREFPAGCLVVELAQPQGRLARAVLEPDPDFEPEFVKEQLAARERNEKRNENERKEPYTFYDVTAWSLPYAYGVEAWWSEDAPPVQAGRVELDEAGDARLAGQGGGVSGGRAASAYVFSGETDSAAILALRLLSEGYRLAAAHRPVRAGGRDWPRGSLVARVNRNPESLHGRIADLSKALGVEVAAIQSAYSDDAPQGINSRFVEPLRLPRIAVAAGDPVSTTGYGAVWHLLERTVGIPFTPIPVRSLTSASLARFNVLILPEGWGWWGAIGKTGAERLRAWAAQGNVLIGLGSGGVWFTEKEAGISTASVVGREPSQTEKKEAAGDKPESNRPKKPVDLPGAVFRLKIDTSHFLGHGVEPEIPALLSGDVFLKPSQKGSNVATFDKGPSRLAGFVWPGNTEELLAGTAYVIDEPIGSGHALLYLQDPAVRSLWRGLHRLLLNGILYGPARTALVPVGADQG